MKFSSFLFCITVPGYFVLNLDFALDLGIMTFTSWRLLVFIMGLPLGIVGILLMLYYESPKFLLSLGRKEEALKTLSQIFKWNGGIGEYPVCKLPIFSIRHVRRTVGNHLRESCHKYFFQKSADIPTYVIPKIKAKRLINTNKHDLTFCSLL